MRQMMQQPMRQRQQQHYQPQEPAYKRLRFDDDDGGEPTPGKKYYAANGSLKPEYVGMRTCRWFEGVRDRPCKFTMTPARCRFPHYCTGCHAMTHSFSNCPTAGASRV